MRILKNISIKRRLNLIIMAVSSISIVLTTLSISIVGVYNLRSDLIKELDVSASIVGERNYAALVFGDAIAARENLTIFSVNKEVLKACLYKNTKDVLAGYEKESSNKSEDVGDSLKIECPSNIQSNIILRDGMIELTKPVIKNEEIVGYIYIKSTQEKINRYIEKQTGITLIVIIASLILSYLLAVRLQKNISEPILNLSDTALQVSTENSYSVRAKPLGDIDKEYNNELVILTNSFNNMLSEIEARDIQLKQQYSELEKAKDVAEGANRAKSQFLANISHELRTPLNAVIGFSSILMNQLFGPLGDQKYMEYAKDINNSGAHLLDIINDILDLSKAEAGKLDINYEEIHVGKAINKCITIMSDRAKKGKVTIDVNIPKMLPPLVVDRMRFIQILLNVLSNAVKFTPENGKVTVNVSNEITDDEVTKFIIQIIDTGIGMSKEEVTHAFERFGQVDSGLNRKYEGTGLGLPLTKKLIEVHNGSISFDSEPNKGTTVTLIFPALPPSDVDYDGK
ncbi:MAG: ATP-binding protein [Rickettsiales bacterium]